MLAISAIVSFSRRAQFTARASWVLPYLITYQGFCQVFSRCLGVFLRLALILQRLGCLSWLQTADFDVNLRILGRF